MSGGRLAGEVALITGGAGGLGRAVVDRFVEEGARVVVLDRDADRLGALADDHGDAVQCHAADVREYRALADAVQVAEMRYGKLDVLIANAGMWDFGASLDETSPEKLDRGFDELFALNVKAYLLAAKAAVPALVRARGAIIFTLSNAASEVAGGGPLYTASKHAALGLMRQLAFELAPAVRVNAVAPGGIATGLSGPAALGQERRSIADLPLGEFLRQGTPLGILPSAEDYAGAYVFLASRRDNRPITGTSIAIDNGIGVVGFPSPGGGGHLIGKYDAEGSSRE